MSRMQRSNVTYPNNPNTIFTANEEQCHLYKMPAVGLMSCHLFQLVVRNTEQKGLIPVITLRKNTR